MFSKSDLSDLRTRVLRALFIFQTLLSVFGATARAGDAVAPVLERPALSSALASNAVLLRVTNAGNRLVAVGERGIVVLSDDGGRAWRQAAVPVSVTLTAVMFVSPRQGWAVGHSGVILHTEDGGESWKKQLDGIRLAKLAVQDARANLRLGSSPKRTTALKLAEQLVSDGPDKPFLALHAFSARHVVAVGAYGLIFETSDGGGTWAPQMSHVNNPRGHHIYGIARHGANIYLAGEQGFFARSIDEGKSFVHVRTPYRGTYFAITVLASGELFIAGLRGHAFRSTDGGKHFTPVASSTQTSFSGIATLRDGETLLTNQAGQLWTWRAGDNVLRHVATSLSLPPLAGVVETADRALIVVGVAGALRLPPLHFASVPSATVTP